jgi:DHA1 family tetracycline resistance protein-like MFS transporter
MQIGGALAASGLAIALVSGFLTGRVVKAVGETRAAYIGLAGAFLGFILYAIAWEDWVIFVAIPVGAIMGLAGPAIRGLMSENVPATEQGELAGALSMLMSLTFIFSPALYTQTFASFSNDARLPHFPGAPYLVAAFFTIVSGLIIRFAMRRIEHIKSTAALSVGGPAP